MPNCGKEEEKLIALKIGGGDKGHITEVVHDPVFIKLFASKLHRKVYMSRSQACLFCDIHRSTTKCEGRTKI
eukprot:scaffold10241_cov256-Chaetoceros_neogracile.AAC.5